MAKCANKDVIVACGLSPTKLPTAPLALNVYIYIYDIK